MRAKLAVVALVVCFLTLAFVIVATKIPFPDGDEPHRIGPDNAKYVEAKGNLRPGVDVYNPHSKIWVGKVVRMADLHLFPDGTKRPAVEVETKGTKTWMPLEGVERFVILQDGLNNLSPMK